MGATAAGAALATFKFPAPAIAQSAPFKLGLLTVKTGPLAQGGIQMEQGVVTYLKEKNYTFAGRKVEFISADTGGNPAGTKTKAQELVERDKVDAILGPLAAFELLAITDYIKEQKTPMLSLAGAEDMTQRRPNPYFLRPSATSAQAMHPMADFAAKELKLKRIITVSEDFAFGHEQMGGFQQTFEAAGGKIVNKIWPPLVTPDYTPFVAQIADCDGVCQGFAGSNPLRFMKTYAAAGLKYPVVTGETGGDDALMRSFGDEAIGMYSSCPYTLDYGNDSNKRFVAAMQKDYSVDPGFYAAGLYVAAQVVDAGLQAAGGKADDKEAFVKALRAVELKDTPRGPIKFDHLGNVVGNFFIRRVEKANGKLVNKTVKTYENVSQFWNYDEKDFLAKPVYSRNYPPLKS
ncbi:ABC transporter substrate-binding protein [Pseudolabrys taiwanensis]|uniref:ABC transporter substrate-binding protein n=2 Tax=Pseudolabrys taiwanensis TaxID=331696 RepID=A0A345ZWR1_9HYPH|nr:ABC transporter substrate-binding protein [Pseudolabrys taiwanensis]